MCYSVVFEASLTVPFVQARVASLYDGPLLPMCKVCLTQPMRCHSSMHDAMRRHMSMRHHTSHHRSRCHAALSLACRAPCTAVLVCTIPCIVISACMTLPLSLLGCACTVRYFVPLCRDKSDLPRTVGTSATSGSNGRAMRQRRGIRLLLDLLLSLWVADPDAAVPLYDLITRLDGSRCTRSSHRTGPVHRTGPMHRTGPDLQVLYNGQARAGPARWPRRPPKQMSRYFPTWP